ncbi:hypothetical protein [Dysgonomonas sp.]
MELIIPVVLIIIGLLNLVLFFKIWKMTDDVSTIKYYLQTIKELLTADEEEDNE